MTKKLAVIGAGTAGSQTILHLVKHFPDYEIEWYFDENIPTQSVGEGAPLNLPRNMSQNMGFNYHEHLPQVDGTLKTGILKQNWGEKNNSFFHEFPAPQVSMHFNAKKLQKFIYNNLKEKISIHNEKTSHNIIDADYIVDCSGTPSDFVEYRDAEYIPVNSVYITQCYWDKPKFDYTLTIARPHGWVFGIPLQNRCSIGYLYNNNISTIEEVEQDVKQVFDEWSLQPSEDTNWFSFKNYYKETNFTERVCFNGNASFFLEPLEATSTAVMDNIQRSVYDIIKGNIDIVKANERYTNQITEIQNMISMHYFAGSKFNTEFWAHAQNLGKNCIENVMSKDSRFVEMYVNILQKRNIDECYGTNYEYGTWWVGSFVQNIQGLGIQQKLNQAVFKF